MNRVVKTTLSLVGSLAVSNAMAVAQTVGNNTGKEEHRSRLAKVAFWRHHKDSDKKAKQSLATPGQSRQAQPKPAQIKGVSAKQGVGQKDHRQVRHAGNASKAPTKKASAANKTKPQQKDGTAASLKQ